MDGGFSWYEWVLTALVTILGGLATLVTTIFSRIVGSMKQDIKEIETEITRNSRDLADFRLHVSDHYPKEVTMQRLYTTLEDMAKDVNALKVMFARGNKH